MIRPLIGTISSESERIAGKVVSVQELVGSIASKTSPLRGCATVGYVTKIPPQYGLITYDQDKAITIT
jgi:hypothetical protein